MEVRKRYPEGIKGEPLPEKIPWEGEFTLRSDPWAGLRASWGSLFLMDSSQLTNYACSGMFQGKCKVNIGII